VAHIKVVVFRNYVNHIKFGALLNTVLCYFDISKFYKKIVKPFCLLNNWQFTWHFTWTSTDHCACLDLPLRSDIWSITCAGYFAFMMYAIAHFLSH